MRGMEGYYINKMDDTIRATFWLPIFKKGYSVMLFMVRHQILIHDIMGRQSYIYPQAVRAVYVKGYMDKNYISSFEYEKGKYCFVKCLGEGELSCYEVPESFDKLESRLHSSTKEEKISDIVIYVGKPTFTNYFVQLEGKKSLFCGQNLFRYRRELATYLSDYPVFARMLNVKRRNWHFSSNADVILTFDQLYGHK